jgi:integrase
LESRLGQDGTVYQEGRKQTDEWLAHKPAYLRIYLDIPGRHEREKRNVPLGKCDSREAARRRADKWIMANGVNDRKMLEATLQPAEITFRHQAGWWLSEIRSGRLKCRQRNKRGQRIRQTTLDAYTTAVTYLNEKIGDMRLATFDNAEMRDLVAAMEAERKENGEPRFTPKTIVNYYLVVAAVFAAAKDRTGKQMFPRDWDLNFIALPAINRREQNTPTLEAKQIETILSSAKERYRVLYAFLAGSTMRISEALGLEIGKHFAADCSIVYVRQQRSKKGHRIEAYPKTDAGIRDIDLAPELSALVKDYIGSRTSGFLFETSTGLPLAPRNVMRDSLHPLLKEMGHGSAGFHTFRRFRESVLQMSEARSLLIDYWMGHANRDMAGRYGKQLLGNIQWRQECAARVGLGFTLPGKTQEPLMDKSGQVFAVEELEVVSI